jgi:hypothetical protein
MNAAPHRIGVVTDRRSMDHNPSSPRVPGYGRGCLTILWRLVSYEVYTKIGRHALLWEVWVNFPYPIHFMRRGNHTIDFFGENVRREVVGCTFSSSIIESWS